MGINQSNSFLNSRCSRTEVEDAAKKWFAAILSPCDGTAIVSYVFYWQGKIVLNTAESVCCFNYLRKMVTGELNDLTSLEGIFDIYSTVNSQY